MKNLVRVAVAIAAAGYSFAAQADSGAVAGGPRTLVEFLRAQGDKPDAAKPSKRSNAEARKPRVSGAAKAVKPAVQRSGNKAAMKQAVVRKAVRSSKRQRVIIDTASTGSIGSAVSTGGQGVKSVAAGLKTASAASSFTPIIARYAAEYGVPASLAHAVIRVESNYRPTALGSAGEIGLMQIKPATARMLGYSGSAKGLYDPDTNIRFGMKYLAMAHDLGGGDTCGTILRYNAGHAATRMNPISSAYCVKVKRHMAEL